MKLIFLGLFLCCQVYSQNCNKFREGIFENKTENGTFRIERYNNFQLESSLDYGIIYLNKIIKKNECEYTVHLYKVINKGVLPEPNTDSLAVKIYKVKNDFFYYRFNPPLTTISIEGVYTKVANEISDGFRRILSTEKNR